MTSGNKEQLEGTEPNQAATPGAMSAAKGGGESKPEVVSNEAVEEKAKPSAAATTTKAGSSPKSPKKVKDAKPSKQGGYDFVRNGLADYPAPSRFVYAFVAYVIWAFMFVFYPSSFEGLDEQIAKSRGKGVVLVMNHVSMVEPVVTIVALWRRGIRVRPLYKLDFEKIGAAKWLFRRMGGIPVDRGSADLKALKACRDALNRGEWVLVYPEGTRIKSDEQKPEIHAGFAMIAQMAKADVVPSAVVGAADPYKTRRTRRRHSKIIVGEAIAFDELPGSSRKEKLTEMERVAMERVYELRDGLRKRYPDLW